MKNNLPSVLDAEEQAVVLRAERLHNLRKELLRLSKTATYHFFKLGEIMKEIRDDELWREQYESFVAFYSDPELGYKRSSVYHAIKLIEMFPEWQKFVDIAVSKLIMLAPYINKKNRNELANQARALSKSDLYHQLKLMRIAIHEPKFESLPKVYPCSVCGKCKGVNWDDLCHCGMTPAQINRVRKIIDES